MQSLYHNVNYLSINEMKRVFYWGTSACYGFDNSSMTLIKNVVYKNKKTNYF